MGSYYKSNLHKCERCGVLVPLRAKRCSPCQDDVRREAHRMHEKRRHTKKAFAAAL